MSSLSRKVSRFTILTTMTHTKLTSAAAAILLACSPAAARDISSYVDWGPTNHNFPQALEQWQPGSEFSPDDNFFISRVRPKARFVNRNTQVHSYLSDNNDKNLIYWVPIGTPPWNSLQSDSFDSDLFSMWQYVTHFGNWSTPLARVPGNFSDAAHKNGVGVSPVVATPWGTLNADWSLTLRRLIDVGPEKMSQFLEYYGIDGLGYNSEFAINAAIPTSQRPKSVGELIDFNTIITRRAAEAGNPCFMNIWYDGTSSSGSIMFDRGLSTHNEYTFGHGDAIASSLFFNYNWNSTTLMQNSVAYARQIGRNPLDLYCGFNMQGGEPRKTTKSWSLLKGQPLSIGLWGAHSESMMYESRRELGSNPADVQRNYLLRTEWWFSGGSRNPASAPEISDTWNYSGYNTSFFGMARLMSARSAITSHFSSCFNIGNGRFFNWNGVRRSDSPWANIGIQDVLPTWRFWWSSKWLGGESKDVPTAGLDAEVCWDEAWLGGSSLRIHGSAQAPEYLHLYKTSIPMDADDIISLSYKLRSGSGHFAIVVAAEGDEKTEIVLPDAADGLRPASADWRSVSYRIGDVAPQLAGKRLAVIALRFSSADNVDLVLGKLSVRPAALEVAPALPSIAHAELLAASRNGVDGKIIWNMPDADRLRYNDDHNVAMFQLFSQQEGCEPVLQSATSSWAGLLLGAPVSPAAPMKFRFGVAPVSTHLDAVADVVWSDWFDASDSYETSHDVVASCTEAYPGEKVNFRLADPLHPGAKWTLSGPDGYLVQSDGANEASFSATVGNPGTYSLSIEYKASPEAASTVVNHEAILRVISADVARAPRIESLDAVVIEPEQTDAPTKVRFDYSADTGAGSRSRGISLYGCQVGGRCLYVGMKAKQSGAFAFWIRPDRLADEESHLFSIRDKSDSWPRNEWGWMYSTIGKNGRGVNVAIRLADRSVEHHFADVYLPEGVWTPMAIAIDYAANGGASLSVYVNGKKHLPTSYSDNGVEYPGAPAPLTNLYDFRINNIFSVGGPLFKTGGVEGAIDNLQYWNVAFNEEKAALAAANPGADGNWPEGLTSFFSFDTDPAADFTFANEVPGSSSSKATVGALTYAPQLTEGSGVSTWLEPVKAEGAPFSVAMKNVQTKAVWSVPGGVVESNDFDGNQGEALVRYDYAGNYTATLRLENECGSDARSVSMIHVSKDAGVNAVASAEAAFSSRVQLAPRGLVALCFDAQGAYDVEIHDLSGLCIYHQQLQINQPGSKLIDSLPAGTPLVVTIRPL